MSMVKTHSTFQRLMLNTVVEFKCVNDSERACMRLIHITFLATFYKNINDKMFTSAASENGAVWMNLVLFPLNWRLFASVLFARVNRAMNNIVIILCNRLPTLMVSWYRRSSSYERHWHSLELAILIIFFKIPWLYWDLNPGPSPLNMLNMPRT